MYFGPALNSRQQYQLGSGYPTAPIEPSGQPDVSSIIGTLWRRRRALFAIFVGFLSLVILWTLLTPKSYTATTKLIAGAGGGGTSRTGDTALPLLNALLAASGASSAETYVALIQQDPVGGQVIRNLNLKTSVDNLFNNISVKPVTNTAIIELSATWSDPDTAAKIANEFANVFISRNRDLIAGQAGSAIDFLQKEMPTSEERMRAADKALADFETSHPAVYISLTETNGVASTSDSAVMAAQQKYAQAKVDSQQAQAQLASVTGRLGSTSPTINGSSSITVNPVVGQLQAQLAQVDVQLQSARQQYTEQHPTVLALEEQKAQLEREIRDQPATIVSGNAIVPNPLYQQLAEQAATLRSQIAGDEGQIKTLDAELGRMNGTLSSLPTQSMQLANLQRKAKMAEDIYTALEQKYNEAVVAKTTALSDVSITQTAFASSASVKPNWKLNLLLGLVLGLVLAISGVFMIEFFDNTFKDEHDVQRALPLPVLTSVPQLSATSPNKLPWLRAMTVESFLRLVSALRYSSDKPLRTLVITSPNQGDGKSTIAMSTAIAMAEVEPKVVLIDADLRRPTLHDKLGLAAEPGLSDYLVGAVSLSEAIQPTKYDGLYLMSSGAHVPNPVKLIHSARLDELIAELLKEYRAIIFDTPALLPVYDAAVLSAKVDGTVLVLSAGLTDMPSTKRAIQRLSSVQGVNMLGIVLNRTNPANGYAAYYLSTDSPTKLPHEDGVASPS
jgi:succinoglycan biosynthesis transport protein ExoP